MRQAAARSVEGVIACTAQGKIAFASGLGNDPRLRALATDKEWMAEIRTRRIQPLNLDHRQ
jgi:hypothetical protein